VTQSVQSIIDERKGRWLRFYDASETPTRLFFVRCDADLGPRPLPRPDNVVDRIDWAWRKYQLKLEQLTWLDDDSLPYLDCYTGTEIFAAAFGCPVHYPDENMPFALPIVRTAEEAAALPIPRLDTPEIARLFAIAGELRRRAGDSVLVRLVDIQSPMDIAALIWDKNTFYTALVQTPDAVLALARKVKALMVAFLDEWFARFGREFIAHYPDYYMPSGLTLSEDEVGVVSRGMFDVLFLPELVELSERYGSLGVHCCAHARHQWAGFKRIPNLRLVNLVQPPEVTRAAVGYFAGLPQMHAYGGEGPAWTWPAQYPADARLVFDVTADSRAQAIETAARLRET
jgi:hypothetical protein